MKELIDQWLLNPTIGKGVASLLVIVVVIILVRALQHALGRYVDSAENRYRLRKLVTFGGYLLAVFLLSIVFSDKLAGLTVFLGVAGAGVAFALQEVIGSAAGWVAMSFGSFYKVGDRVQLGGIKGDVIDIGVLRTTLMECGGWINGDQYNGRVVRVANSFIFKEPVFNYSSDFPFLWDEMLVSLRFGSDYELARQGFQKILEDVTGNHAHALKGDWRKMTDKYLLEEAGLEPVVTLSMSDSAVVYTLRYVVDYKRRRGIRDQISQRLLSFIEESDGVVVLASTSFEVSAVPPSDIELRDP